MKTLTIRQPWVFAIAEDYPGPKRVENRTRRAPAKHIETRIAIHAGQTFDAGAAIVRNSRAAARRLDELGGRSAFWDARHYLPSRIFPPPHPTLAMSAIIATALLVGCHASTGCCTPWGEPPASAGEKQIWHWQLDDVRALTTPVPCGGALGLWTPTDDIVTSVLAQEREQMRRQDVGDGA